MHYFCATLLTACFCLMTAQAFAPAFTSPVFMWSNTQYFTGQNVVVNELMSTEDVVSSLGGGESPLKIQLKEGRQQPEIVFVFVEPELRTEQFPMLADAYSVHPSGGAFSKLKGTIESYARSSLVVPFTHVGNSKSIGSSIATDMITNLPQGGNVIVVNSETAFSGRTGIQRLTLEGLKVLLSTKDCSLLSNGVTDVVIVYFSSPAVHPNNVDQVSSSYANDDAYMHSILDSMTASYLAIFTADKPASESIKQARASLSVQQLAPQSIYPGDVLEAQIVMIPFLFILLVGLCCTSSVQSDLKFDAEKKVWKKVA